MGVLDTLLAKAGVDPEAFAKQAGHLQASLAATADNTGAIVQRLAAIDTAIATNEQRWAHRLHHLGLAMAEQQRINLALEQLVRQLLTRLDETPLNRYPPI
jgi:hypothetical protein